MISTDPATSVKIAPESVDAQVLDRLQKLAQTQQSNLVNQLSYEEHQAILAKMVGFSRSAAGHLPKEDELYLEQQLTDLLGFEVTAELENHRLAHLVGVMKAAAHLKRFATDSINQHDAFLEAELAPKRSFFGFFTHNQVSSQVLAQEKYYIGLPLFYFPEWNKQATTLTQFYKYRKLLVINAADAKAVVVVVGDVGPMHTLKYQFLGSPEVIRTGSIWSYKNQGHVLIFFIDDPDDQVKLGPIDLAWKNK